MRNTPILKIDFDGRPCSFNAEGWFNATEAAKRFQAEPVEWLRQRESVTYIATLAKHLFKSDFLPELNRIKELDGSSAKSRRLVLELVKRTGLVKTKPGAPENGGGTWMHPKLAVPFARWLNIDFAVWCDLQIDAIVRGAIQAQGNTNLLPLFLRDAAAVWEIRFKPDYYQALAKLTGTTYTGHAGGTNPIYGHITDQWVYACILPSDVHAELKARRGKSQKMHQWLSAGGQELLDKQIALVQSIASTSADLRDFEARMMAVSAGRPGQTGFIFPRAA